MKQLPGPRFVVGDEAGAEGERNRDSGVQFLDQSGQPEKVNQPLFRDSGYVPSPIARPGWDETSNHSEAERPPRPFTPTSSSEDLRKQARRHSARTSEQGMSCDTALETLPRQGDEGSKGVLSAYEAEHHRDPSPVDSTTKDRSSRLFDSSPSHRLESFKEAPSFEVKPSTSFDDALESPSLRGVIEDHSDPRDQAPIPASSLDSRLTETSYLPDVSPTEPYRSIFGPLPQDALERPFSPPKTPLQTIPEDDRESERSPALRRQRSPANVASPTISYASVGRSLAPNLEGRVSPESQPALKKLRRSRGSGDIRRASLGSEHSESPNRLMSPGPELEQSYSPRSATSHSDFVTAAAAIGAAGLGAAALISNSRDDASVGDTKSLGNVDLKPATSKQQRRARQVDAEGLPSSSTYDPVNDKGKEVVRDMADVYVSALSCSTLCSILGTTRF
jgi:hypothetical protein